MPLDVATRMADDPARAFPVPTLDDDDEISDGPDEPVTDVYAAREELEGLHAKTIDLAGKLGQAKEQLQRQLEAEGEVMEIIEEAQAEIERLRLRIPLAYNPRAQEETLMDSPDLPDFSIVVEDPRDRDVSAHPAPAYKSKPKKGVLGMEVALYGDFVQVQRLVPGGACQNAGILENDIIRTWNGKLISNQNDFVRATSVCGAGIPLNVEVQREGVRGLLTFEVIPRRK
jgi:predicted metalloprotease with PDZ domain